MDRKIIQNDIYLLIIWTAIFLIGIFSTPLFLKVNYVFVYLALIYELLKEIYFHCKTTIKPKTKKILTIIQNDVPSEIVEQRYNNKIACSPQELIQAGFYSSTNIKDYNTYVKDVFHNNFLVSFIIIYNNNIPENFFLVKILDVKNNKLYDCVSIFKNKKNDPDITVIQNIIKEQINYLLNVGIILKKEQNE